jgi:uncharacterized protein YnzC (UPF0291/DUF896 family)
MEKEKIDRINHLARKSKAEGLTEEEKAEQAALRAAYVAEFRAGLRGTLDNTYIQRPDGKKEKLSTKADGKA